MLSQTEKGDILKKSISAYFSMIENQYDLMLFWTYRLLLYKQNI